MKVVSTLSKQKVVGVAAAIGMSLVMAAPAFAQNTTDTFGVQQFGANTVLGQQDVRSTIAQIINVALGLLGVISVVIVLGGGFKWMTAGGNEDRVGEAKKMIVAGVIGLAIILSAYAIARFAIGQLSNATGTGDVPGFVG
jgi:hypothetical protein